MWRAILREPLVHFLVAGLFVFLVVDWMGGAERDDTIRVTQDDILTMMQYRSRAFDPAAFEQRWAAMSNAERQTVIDEYIQEEALYREAQRLGLGDNDYVIKRRMIQKVDFLINNRIRLNESVDSTALIEYYESNKEQYRTPSIVTFSHIYFAGGDGEHRAQELLASSQLNRIKSSKALPYGDRFLYHRNYVEESLSTIGSHFGQDFAEELQALEVNDSEWQGPLTSDHGYHLVLISELSDSNVPPYHELRSRVREDYQRVQSASQKKKAVEALIEEYNILIDID